MRSPREEKRTRQSARLMDRGERPLGRADEIEPSVSICRTALPLQLLTRSLGEVTEINGTLFVRVCGEPHASYACIEERILRAVVVRIMVVAVPAVHDRCRWIDTSARSHPIRLHALKGPLRFLTLC